MITDFLKLFGLSFMLMVGSFHAASAFEFESIDGGVLNLEDFKGKPVLIVNTASRCGFTYQYKGCAVDPLTDVIVVIGRVRL